MELIAIRRADARSVASPVWLSAAAFLVASLVACGEDVTVSASTGVVTGADAAGADGSVTADGGTTPDGGGADAGVAGDAGNPQGDVPPADVQVIDSTVDPDTPVPEDVIAPPEDQVVTAEVTPGATCQIDEECGGKVVVGVCQVAKCVAGKCETAAAPDGSACTLNDACITKSGCSAGACAAVAVKVCDDGDPCSKDACDPASGACSATAIAGCVPPCKGNADCDDKNTCTADTCDAVSGKCSSTAIPGCQGCAKDGDCDDKNGCTADKCDGGKCTFGTLAGANCDDGNPCTQGDQCSADKCQGLPANCDDKNPCTKDACDPANGKCGAAPADGSCDDGNLCTISDVCVGGKCLPGANAVCEDGNACTTDSCDPASGKCKTVAAPEGSP